MEVDKSLDLSEEGKPSSQLHKASLANSILSRLKTQLRPLLGLILITIVFMIFAPTYRQWPAIRDILEQSTVMLIMATGTTIILLSGNLDLSVGSILALVAVVVGSLLIAGTPVWLAVLIALGVGTLCGFINGFIVVTTGPNLPGVSAGRSHRSRHFARSYRSTGRYSGRRGCLIQWL